MKSNREPNLEEFKFHYHFENAVGFSDKYFLAHNIDEAKEMFDYACCKRHLHPHLDGVEKWNRWKSSWEKIVIPELKHLSN
ncbi:MAG: hypothetical protein P8P49_13140, partial [Opitutales bacterium]|nr:hypothetical protein [Opitutales bacterium]